MYNRPNHPMSSVALVMSVAAFMPGTQSHGNWHDMRDMRDMPGVHALTENLHLIRQDMWGSGKERGDL